MCLIICAHRHSTDTPLAITANRDEFFSRPTLEADFWPDQPIALLAGKDLTQGGSWLGINQNGRFAAVTNIRNPQRNGSGKKSRGFLVSDFLSTSSSAEDYLQGLMPGLELFAGFNLLLSDGENLYYLNNQDQEIKLLPAGIYGLSNGTLDSPWPKIERGKKLLKRLLNKNLDISTEALIDIMTDRQIARDEGLPDTGVSIELERMLSASFISNPDQDYGTRCTTAIVQDKSGTIRFSEQSYNRDSSIYSRKFFSFAVQQAALAES